MLEIADPKRLKRRIANWNVSTTPKCIKQTAQQVRQEVIISEHFD